MLVSVCKGHFSVIFLALLANTSSADVPHTFKDGDIIRAEEINENFQALDSAILNVGPNPIPDRGPLAPDYIYEAKEGIPGSEIQILDRRFKIVSFFLPSLVRSDVKFKITMPLLRNIYITGGNPFGGLGVNTWTEGREVTISGKPGFVMAEAYIQMDLPSANPLYSQYYNSATWTAVIFAGIAGENPFFEIQGNSEEGFDLKITCQLSALSGTFDTNIEVTSQGFGLDELPEEFQQFEAAIQECIKNYPNQEAVFKSRTFAFLNDTVTVLLDYGTALRFSPGFFLDPHPCNNSDEEKPNCTVYSSDLDFTNDPAEEVYLESIQERIPINRARAEGTKTFLDYIIISEVVVEN